MNNKENWEALFATLGIAFLSILILAYPTMWIWNNTMPAIFSLPQISFWQALGLNVLANIFFKNNSKD